MLKITKPDYKKDVYDLTVNDNHNFFANDILVHNCAEITLPTYPMEDINADDESETSLCILSCLNLGALKNLDEMEETCELIVRTLDFIVEHQEYPVKSAEKMLKRRSLGIGITNLAYYFAKNKVGYDETSYQIVHDVAEFLQYYLLKASNKLAKEFGPCEYFVKTTYSKGILPIDTYNKNVDKIIEHKLKCDWETLRKDIKEFGLRNSCLSCCPPTESSSVNSNATNGIEPPRSLISTKKSKMGLLKQVVPEINKIGHLYTTAYEMPNNKGMIDIVAIMQKFIDQSISMNNYYDFTKYEDGELPISEVINDIFYAYSMGVKTMYYANSNDGKKDNDEGGCAGGACSV